jgi:type IV pilus assembly protein PilM
MIGIDLDEDRLRFVQIVLRGGVPHVAAAGTVPMPSGSYHGGVVRQVGAVAIALKRLLEGMGVGASQAAIGLSMDGYAARTLSLPPAPDDERPMLVAGEVEHFRVIRSSGGVFDYFPLEDPSPQKGGKHHFAVVATEEEGPRSVRDLADRSGVTVAALEPLGLALLRSAFHTQGDLRKGRALCLSMDRSHSELVLLESGRVRTLRRIDFGLQHCLESEPHRVGYAGQVDEALAAPQGLRDGAEMFVTDLSRSLDFFQREYGLDTVDRIWLAGSAAGVQQLAPFVTERLGIPTTAVDCKGVPVTRSEIQKELAEDGGTRYLGALGLALRMVQSGSNDMPRADLFSQERAGESLEGGRRRLTGSLVVGAASLALGVVLGLLFGMQAKGAEAELAQARQRLETSLADQQRVAKEIESARIQLQLLSRERLALDRLADSVAVQLPEGVGLSDLSVNSGDKVILRLESRDEESMIQAVRRLHGSGYLVFPALASFEKRGSGFEFTINASAVRGLSATGAEKE